MGSGSNARMGRAQKTKNDEFYTQMPDIEKEMRHYKNHFRGKVIYCNCDDPSVSNFFRHFVSKFENYGLKKVITTCYRNDEPTLFSQNKSEHGVVIEYEGGGGVE